VKAVNLIPADTHGGGGGAPRAGSGVFVLLGVLAALVAGVSFYVLTSNTIADRRAQVTSMQAQASAAQATAASLQPYRDFASLAQSRVETVRQLGAARFDWHRAFSELATVIPGNVWLTSLLGTVAPGVSVDGASSGATSGLRSTIAAPAIEMSGCTVSHDSVVQLISHLRLMDGVQRVSLADSSKDGGTAGSGGGGCQNGHPSFPQFDLVIFFEPLPGLPTAPGAATSTATPAAATAGTTAAPAGTAQPAASTTPAPSAAPSTSAGGSIR
jgi:Tfp pilus assembly protein PilN